MAIYDKVTRESISCELGILAYHNPESDVTAVINLASREMVVLKESIPVYAGKMNIDRIEDQCSMNYFMRMDIIRCFTEYYKTGREVLSI